MLEEGQRLKWPSPWNITVVSESINEAVNQLLVQGFPRARSRPRWSNLTHRSTPRLLHFATQPVSVSPWWRKRRRRLGGSTLGHSSC